MNKLSPAEQEELVRVRKLMRPNPFREAFENGRIAASLACFSIANYQSGTYAANAGFQATYVDMEHSMVGFETAAEIFAGTLAAGITPLVRVPLPTPEWVSRALDGGAVGVVVPHIQNAAEARELVKYAKFSPLGERSVGAYMPMFGSVPVPPKLAAVVANEQTIVVCMLENVEAIEQADEIAAVEGVDILHIGTNDLCDNLGIPFQYDHPKVQEMINKVCSAAAKASVNGRKVYVGVGALLSKPDLLRRIIAEDQHKVIRFLNATDYSLVANAFKGCADVIGTLM